MVDKVNDQKSFPKEGVHYVEGFWSSASLAAPLQTGLYLSFDAAAVVVQAEAEPAEKMAVA